MWSSTLTTLSFFTIPLLVRGLVAPVKRADVCNGHAELCKRSYGNTTFLASHDSYADSKLFINPARTQEIPLREQLDAGARMLQAQAHKKDDELHFCHTSCLLLDGGSVTDYLKDVKSWLDDNPKEVLTFVFTNPEAVPVEADWKKAFDDSGITPLAFVPPKLPVKKSEWPTLGEMIDSGKRVVVFMDSNADPSKVDFILPQFDMLWEPPFDATDPTFPCKVDRITGDLSVADHMYMLNHNLESNIIPIGEGVLVPDFLKIDTTNALPSIEADAKGCIPVSENNSNPNFVMLDFMNKGDGVKAVDRMNGFN